MRAAFGLSLAVLLNLAPPMITSASDWVEDEPAHATTMPPVAPPINRIRRNAGPYSESAPGNVDEEDSHGRSTFVVKPRSQPGIPSGPLEATVSKWGGMGQSQGNYLRGAASTMVEAPSGLVPLNAARSVPPGVFRGWLEKTHQAFALTTSTQNPMNVLEVKGQWDDADRTLRSLGIRHTKVRKGKLADMALDDVKVLVVNCAGNVPSEAYQRVRDFVARGGFLVSTDWTVHNLVQHAFPGYIEWNGGKTDGSVMDATVVDPDPVLFAGAVRSSGWKVDDGSQTIRVLRPNAVRILVRSRMLTRDDPDHQGILAVVFSFGRGQVLHLVGHFDNNANLAFTNMLPDPAPVIGISLRQALATNFVVAGLNRASR